MNNLLFNMHSMNIKVGKKLKWSRYRPGVAQREGRGIALLFHDRGTRRGSVVSSTPPPHSTPRKDPVPILQEAGWTPGPVWTGGKSRPHRDSIIKVGDQYYLSFWKQIPNYFFYKDSCSVGCTCFQAQILFNSHLKIAFLPYRKQCFSITKTNHTVLHVKITAIQSQKNTVPINTDMHRVTTFRSTTDCIYDGGPKRL